MTKTLDVTNDMRTCREAIRATWNCWLRPLSTWDARKVLSDIGIALFDALVLTPNGASGPGMAGAEDPDAKATSIVVGLFSNGRMLVNRGDRTPYWDEERNFAEGSEIELRFVRFFDFDELGWRDLLYAEVVVDRCPGEPELVGRLALVPWSQIERFTTAAV